MSKKERKKITSCGAVTWRLNEGSIELLLIKQFSRKDVWSIPKGKLNKDETLEECAVREVREETGVEVTLETRLPDVSYEYNDDIKTVVSYLARPRHSDVINDSDPNNEVAEARWIRVDSLPRIQRTQESLIATAVRHLMSVGPTVA